MLQVCASVNDEDEHFAIQLIVPVAQSLNNGVLTPHIGASLACYLVLEVYILYIVVHVLAR